MTNNTNSITQWEVAGSKRSNFKNVGDLDAKKGSKVPSKILPSKIPVVDTLKPLKIEGGIYDYFVEKDDEEEKKTKSKKHSPKATKNKGGEQTSPKAAKSSAPVSPKQQNKKEDSSKVASKKKATTLSPGKKIANELETAISELRFEDFQQKYNQLENLFPDNLSLIVIHLSAFLNQALNDVPDIEPNQNHENESNFYPSNKLDKKIEKFLNNLVFKLKRSDTEHVFEYCLNEIIRNENPKVLSNHGLRIFIQLLLKHNPSLMMTNLGKTTELLFANRHRHQRIMLALWSLSQAGYLSLSNGLRIWFEAMLPLISIKHYSVYISDYLYVLFEHHKVDSRSIESKLKNQYTISLDRYFKLYDLVNDKSLNVITNKEAAQRFKSAFLIVRSLFMSSLTHAAETSFIFETLLHNISAENSPKQTEFLEILANCLFSKEVCLTKWKELYSKYIQQSSVLLDHLTANHAKKFNNLKNMRETLIHFVEQTKRVASSPTKEEAKKPYYINKKIQKSNNTTLEFEKFNKLAQQTLKQNFKRVSIMSMVFRMFLAFVLCTSLFFYWDVTQNKSSYTKMGEKQLQKYGLHEQAVKVIDVTHKNLLNAQKMIQQKVPIWYKKTSNYVSPYMNKARKIVVEFSTVAWNNAVSLWNSTEAYRKNANIYTDQAQLYVKENFPVLIKSLNEFADLAVDYSIRANELFTYYLNHATNYVGTQLLGLKKGELERIFLDAYKVALEKATHTVNWVSKSLKNLQN